ncbi:TKL/DRK protein kinase [Phytophthora cinnamomi]|uniref:TKL/DRK protein kinase n=1 Tax=Phytophthora cinnamomi TaxID=4785 RepID=UPI00355A4DBB|nr:TKL/DRK protein kinase [Phytophthora cinnamomi]
MAFDGTTSDIARQLYYRAKANDSVSQLVLDQVPAAVQTRLEDLNLDWKKLPGIAQRAVLWDTGYAFTLQNTAVQVWTLGNHTMADLALTVDEYEGAGCVPMNCTEPDSTVMYANLYCNGAQMDNVAKCVVQEFEDDNSYHAAMWSTGGNPATAPTPRVSKHVWFDQGANVSYAIMAVHTVSIENEPSYSVCPAGYENGGYGSVIFPCRTTANITDEDKAEMQVVQGSDWLSQWLTEDYPEAVLDPGSDFDLLLLIPIILGGIILLALVGLAIYCCKRRRRRSMQNTNEFSSNPDSSPSPSPMSYLPYMTSPPKHADMRGSKTRQATEAVSEHLTSATYSGSDQSFQFPGGYSEYESNSTLKILLTSKLLVGKRIPVESLSFERALSKGASGEVWLCDYAGQQVAAKRLLQTKEHKVEDVHEFAEEIELNASLEHKNISTFIGVFEEKQRSLVVGEG